MKEGSPIDFPRAWPPPSLAEAYHKLLGAEGLFRENAATTLRAGSEFALTSSSGEKTSGHVELVQGPRGICLRVTEWNDALFWLTIEGDEGKIEAQIWISTFGLPQTRVDEFREVWGSRLREVLQ